MDVIDKILASTGTAVTSYIDAWGRVKIASLDGIEQPYAANERASSVMSSTMLIVLCIAAVGVVMVLKK